MSTIEYFMQPEVFFRSISNILTEQGVKVIFDRPESLHFSAGLTLCDLADDLPNIYLSGGYQTLYLSVGEVPSSDIDWTFIDNVADEIIEIRGGRIKDKYLEMFTMRNLTKVTKTKPLFIALKKVIVSKSNSGSLVTNNTNYPKIMYEKGIEQKYILCSSFGGHIFVVKKTGTEEPRGDGTLSRG